MKMEAKHRKERRQEVLGGMNGLFFFENIQTT
jgi:hypothetical protein